MGKISLMQTISNIGGFLQQHGEGLLDEFAIQTFA